MKPELNTHWIWVSLLPVILQCLLPRPSGGYTDDQRYEVGIALDEDGTQIWKTCSPADVKDSINEKAVWDDAPFKFFVKRDEAAKNNIYEFAVPWTYLDRTGTMTFKEGSRLHNYSCNAHTREEYESGNPHYMEYGGGIWANSYEDGMIVTLGRIRLLLRKIIEEAPEAAADPAAEAPAAETAAAPAAAEPAAQTSDGDCNSCFGGCRIARMRNAY